MKVLLKTFKTSTQQKFLSKDCSLSKTILAIDIGSTKICAIIAEVAEDDSVAITGAGVARAQGLKKGSITNIELASKSKFA
jgi:cell division ATPase FtsA